MKERAFLLSDWATRTILPMAFSFWAESEPRYADQGFGFASELRDLTLRTLRWLGVPGLGDWYDNLRTRRASKARDAEGSLHALRAVTSKETAEAALGALETVQAAVTPYAKADKVAAVVLNATNWTIRATRVAISTSDSTDSLRVALEDWEVEIAARPKDRAEHPYVVALQAAGMMFSFAYERTKGTYFAKAFDQSLEGKGGYKDSRYRTASGALHAYTEAVHAAHPEVTRDEARAGARRAIKTALAEWENESEDLVADPGVEARVVSEARRAAEAALDLFKSVCIASGEPDAEAKVAARAAYEERITTLKERYRAEHPKADVDSIFGSEGQKAAQEAQAAHEEHFRAERAYSSVFGKTGSLASLAGTLAGAVARSVASVRDPREIWKLSLTMLDRLINAADAAR